MSATTIYNCGRCRGLIPYLSHRNVLTVSKAGDELAATYKADLCGDCVYAVQTFVRRGIVE